MNTTPQKPREQRTNRAIVLQAIVDLCEHNQAASRARIADITGMKLSTLDERIFDLKAAGLIRSPAMGIFEPIDQSPDRPVSTTSMPFGKTKIEVGDEILTLTPREAFALAKALGGHLLAFSAPLR